MSVLTVDRSAQISPGASGQPVADSSVEDLLWRMRTGDRNAAAEFLNRYGSQIRRRIRGKLGPSVRRLFDSTDILSTLGRRLDLFVMAGRLQAQNELQLWQLLHRMADRALVDKVRVVRTKRNVESPTGAIARQHAQRAKKVTTPKRDGESDVELDQCLSMVDQPLDRRIVLLWVSGETFVNIGRAVNLSEDAVRKRFNRVQAMLKDRLQSMYQ